MRPSDLPSIKELGERKSCGTRLRYMAGCRCVPCRAANSSYETMRAAERRKGNWNGLVPAMRARRHLIKLSRLGIGRDSVAAASDVGVTTISEVFRGIKLNIRSETEKKLLSVTKDAVADHGYVSARRTWVLLNRLLSEGITKTELSRRLGYKGTLQFNKEVVTAKTAGKVERFYRRIMVG